MSSTATTPDTPRDPRRREITAEEEKLYPFVPLTKEDINHLTQFVGSYADGLTTELVKILKEYQVDQQDRYTRQHVLDGVMELSYRLQIQKTPELMEMMRVPNLPPRQVAVSTFRPPSSATESFPEEEEEEIAEEEEEEQEQDMKDGEEEKGQMTLDEI